QVDCTTYGQCGQNTFSGAKCSTQAPIGRAFMSVLYQVCLWMGRDGDRQTRVQISSGGVPRREMARLFQSKAVGIFALVSRKRRASAVVNEAVGRSAANKQKGKREEGEIEGEGEKRTKIQK